MRRILIKVAYDGTNYSGWQLQNGHDTIESELLKAIGAITGETDLAIIGASRTDAGVHSLGNMAVFDTKSSIPAEKFARAINTRLPADIRVQSSSEVALDFHPRKQNSIKTYEYRILNRSIELPTERLYSYFYYGSLNLDAMREAAALLVGEHDFASFCSSGSQARDTIRRLYSCEVLKEGDTVIVRVSGNGFLYNMVRIIAGTLLTVGIGQMTPSDVSALLLSRNRNDAGRKIPACGLTMVDLTYCRETFPQEIHSDTWDYVLMQTSDGSVWMDLTECRTESECNILVGKLANHAYRDGAPHFFLRAFGHLTWVRAGYHPGNFMLEENGCIDAIRPPENDSSAQAGKWYHVTADYLT